MKKDLPLSLGTLSLWLMLSAGAFATSLAHAKDGQKDLTRAQIGRAFLTVEDLKTLLGLRARDPSSETVSVKKEVSETVPFVEISVPDSEKSRLARSIQKIEIERARLEVKSTQQAESAKKSIRTARVKIQNKRLNASGEKDADLGRHLFESLLEEANLDADLDQQLRNFDQDHAVSVEFVDQVGYRKIVKINLGEETVWTQKTQASSTMVAQP